MKILVTGFEPFGGESINPSLEAVKNLPDRIGSAQIIPLQVPTVMGKALQVIAGAVERYEPDVILSIGQAGGRSEISVERIGINLDDYRIPDNEGNQPEDQPIFEDGPDAYFSNLPVKVMAESIRRAGIPASVSNTAGTFVCNHVLYGVRYMLEKEGKGRKSGFIHIPYLPQQAVDKARTPSMSLEDIEKGICAAIEAVVRECGKQDEMNSPTQRQE